MAHFKQGGYSAEYAKSGRSSCAGCGSTIADKSLRIGHATPSSFHGWWILFPLFFSLLKILITHWNMVEANENISSNLFSFFSSSFKTTDGYDTKWYHFKCLYFTPGTKFADIKGSEMLRWADQLKLRERTNEPVGKDAAWKQAEEINKKLWEVKDQISGIQNKILSALLEANGIEVHKMQVSRSYWSSCRVLSTNHSSYVNPHLHPYLEKGGQTHSQGSRWPLVW